MLCYYFGQSQRRRGVLYADDDIMGFRRDCTWPPIKDGTLFLGFGGGRTLTDEEQRIRERRKEYTMR